MTTARPFFLSGSAGPLFCLDHPPAADSLPQGVRRGSLLYLPPFAEEANRARRMAVLQAGRLARRGWRVLLLDPFGTGDSAGDFHQARWSLWLDDASRAADWLTAQGPGDPPPVLWGLRLGALLAAQLAAEAKGRFRHLLFWQPLLRGDRFMTQFLRLRVAAAMAAGEKESGKDLRARLEAGEILEVAGYELAPELVRAIEGLSLETLLAGLGDTRVDWLEVNRSTEGPAMEKLVTTPASARLIESLPAQGGPSPRALALSGEPFWAIQEITLAPKLLDATDALFA